MTSPSTPDDPPELDVDRLHGRRNDERWNRAAVGDVLERLAWSEPRRTALPAAPGAGRAVRSERARRAGDQSS